MEKQPWEMTKQEFEKIDKIPSIANIKKGQKIQSLVTKEIYQVINKHSKGLDFEITWKNLNTGNIEKGIIGKFRQKIYGGSTHRHIVYVAMLRGKHIPQKVLKEYPDLINSPS